MSMGDFITYAAGQPAPFDAECVIINNGGSDLLATLELNMLGSNDVIVESVTNNIGVIEGSGNNSFKFLSNPEEWKSCYELEAVIYTDSEVIRLKASRNGTVEPENIMGVGGVSGGCNASLGMLGILLFAAFAVRKKQ